MDRRSFVAGSAALMCSPAIGRAQSARVLKFIPQGDLGSLDPIWTPNFVTRNHAYLVFDTLFGQPDADGGARPTPQMASGHVVENDGKVWRLTLRDGLRFHDGERVLARDCAASVRRWGARDSFGQALLQQVDEISAPDDRTLLFRLKQPFPMLAAALGKSNGNMCAIMPERLAKTDPFKQIAEMVGSGPFRFKADERVAGAFASYERFREYVPRADDVASGTSGPKIAHFDSIEWHVIPDPATAAAALQSGELDWWELAAPDLLPVMRRNTKITLRTMTAGKFAPFLRPNHAVPPFDNPAIRRALLGGVDQAAFMMAAVAADPELWQVPCGFFPPGSPLASEAGMAALTSPRDPAQVRAALQRAGYRGEKVALLAATDYPTLKGMSEVAADMMKRVGLNVEYQASDSAVIVQRRNSRQLPEQGGWNAFCASVTAADIATPATNFVLRGNGDKAFPGWPLSPQIEKLREQWFGAPDLEAEQTISAAIQRQAFEDVPYYPLGFYSRPTAYRSSLSGVLNDIPVFWNVRRS